MSQVWYFGKSSYEPFFVQREQIDPYLRLVDFELASITQFKDMEEEVIYKNYIIKLKQNIHEQVKFNQVVIGNNTVHLIDLKMNLWSFGQNTNSQIGINKLGLNQQKPMNVSSFNEINFVLIASGGSHSIGLSESNKLYGWGDTEFNCIGNFKEIKKINYMPTQIPKDFINGSQNTPNKIQQICCDHQFTMIVDNQKIYTLGTKHHGKLGRNSSQDFQVTIPQNPKIKGVSCSKYHCLAWDVRGHAYSWGDANYGKLCLPSLDGGFKYIQPVPNIINELMHLHVLSGSCGDKHTNIITNNGELYSWGMIDFVKNEQITIRPQKIKGLDDDIEVDPFFIKVISKENMNAALDKSNKLFCWGQNNQQCLGFKTDLTNNPTCVKKLKSRRIIDMDFGVCFMVAITCQDNEYVETKNSQQLWKLNFSRVQNVLNEIKLKGHLTQKKEKPQPSHKQERKKKTFNEVLKNILVKEKEFKAAIDYTDQLVKQGSREKLEKEIMQSENQSDGESIDSVDSDKSQKIENNLKYSPKNKQIDLPIRLKILNDQMIQQQSRQERKNIQIKGLVLNQIDQKKVKAPRTNSLINSKKIRQDIKESNNGFQADYDIVTNTFFNQKHANLDESQIEEVLQNQRQFDTKFPQIVQSKIKLDGEPDDIIDTRDKSYKKYIQEKKMLLKNKSRHVNKSISDTYASTLIKLVKPENSQFFEFQSQFNMSMQKEQIYMQFALNLPNQNYSIAFQNQMKEKMILGQQDRTQVQMEKGKKSFIQKSKVIQELKKKENDQMLANPEIRKNICKHWIKFFDINYTIHLMYLQLQQRQTMTPFIYKLNNMIKYMKTKVHFIILQQKVKRLPVRIQLALVQDYIQVFKQIYQHLQNQKQNLDKKKNYKKSDFNQYKKQDFQIDNLRINCDFQICKKNLKVDAILHQQLQTFKAGHINGSYLKPKNIDLQSQLSQYFQKVETINFDEYECKPYMSWDDYIVKKKQEQGNTSQGVKQLIQDLQNNVKNIIFQKKEKKYEEKEDKSKKKHEDDFNLLPFSLHYKQLNPIDYFNPKYENKFYQQFLNELIQFDQKVKSKAISNIFRLSWKKYTQKTFQYLNELTLFANQNQLQVNEERASMMLKTSQLKLQAIHISEELDFRQKISRLQNFDLIQRDHLPYVNYVFRIAEQLPGAPRKPQFKIIHNSKVHREIMEKYFEEFKYMQQRLQVQFRNKNVEAIHKKSIVISKK